MVTVRDIEKVVSLLRRIYNIIIIDAPPIINDTTLTYLDDADGILTIVTPDRNSVRAARLAGQAFVAAGMSPHKMMLIMNRAGTPGISPEQMGAELGRLPDFAIPDDPPLVKATSAEGVPFVMAHPKSVASQRIVSIAQRLMAPPDVAAAQPAPSLAQSSA
jgi:pilus assembly protein CpaE